jgi:hypothetical protein
VVATVVVATVEDDRLSRRERDRERHGRQTQSVLIGQTRQRRRLREELLGLDQRAVAHVGRERTDGGGHRR